MTWPEAFVKVAEIFGTVIIVVAVAVCIAFARSVEMSYRVNHGGLLRCCLLTLDKDMEAGGSQDEGRILKCQYCSSEMIVEGGAWKWKRPAEAIGL